jgi:ABC-2 type transport system permease protein
MRKILVIAAREYRVAVRTKAFIISLALIPALMGLSILINVLNQKMQETKEKLYAVVDRTPGQTLFPVLEAAVKVRNETKIFDPDTKKQTRPVFLLNSIPPSAGDDEAMKQQRLELSQRVKSGEFYGFLEIGPDVTRPPEKDADPTAKPEDRVSLRYQTSKPQESDFAEWAREVVSAGVVRERLEGAGHHVAEIQRLQQPVNLRTRGLSKVNPTTGEYEEPKVEAELVNIFVPIGLLVLMYMLILIGATPAMQGVVEEKMNRIAEVLLGSVRPFELMLGKLLGMTAVSLTVSAVYFGAAYSVANHYQVADLLRPGLLAWFVVYQILALLLYGSLFIAVGAAASDMKETQSLLMPVMIIVMLPMFMITPIVMDPTSTFSTLVSFFPPSTPMIMIARQAVPPGIPWWQPVLGIVLVLATTLGCVYAAGRIFRVGLLMQGKGAKLSDLVKWVISG